MADAPATLAVAHSLMLLLQLLMHLEVVLEWVPSTSDTQLAGHGIYRMVIQQQTIASLKL